jgi:hypothetical protein
MIRESYRHGDSVTVIGEGDVTRRQAADHARRYCYTHMVLHGNVRTRRLQYAGQVTAQQTTPTVTTYRYRLIPV